MSLTTSNRKTIGTEYGGHFVDLGIIPEHSVIIDAGVGEDISFSEELYKLKHVEVVAIDPTYKSYNFMKAKNLSYVTFLNKAIYKNSEEKIKLYRNANPNWVSDSVYSSHNAVGKDYYESETISITDLRKLYPNMSLIKFDIEGSEYDVYEQCLGVPQVCIEFHSFVIRDKTKEDDSRIVDVFQNNGYELIYSGGQMGTCCTFALYKEFKFSKGK